MSSRRLAVCSWSLAPGGPDELIAALRKLEVPAVQLALVPLVEDRPVWGDAIGRLRRAGIEIVSGMLATVGEDYSTLASITATGGVRPDATWPATLERARRVARIASDERIPLVTFHAGFIPHDGQDPTRGVLIDRLRTVHDLFVAHGVAIALETGQEEADTLLVALADLRRPTAGVNFDPANMILYGMGEPCAALRKLRGWVRQVHIKDARTAARHGEWGTEVVVGTGEVDWPTFLALVGEIAPPVNVVIEREAGATRMEDIARAAELVRRHLDVG